MTLTPIQKQQWWSLNVWPKWIKTQADKLVLWYSKAVLSFMEDEVGAMFALMSLLLVGCLLIPNMLVVVFLSLVALSVFNALSYYFIHDKTQEKDMRELARWAFIISACAVLVIVPIMSIVQIVWMIKFY